MSESEWGGVVSAEVWGELYLLGSGGCQALLSHSAVIDCLDSQASIDNARMSGCLDGLLLTSYLSCFGSGRSSPLLSSPTLLQYSTSLLSCSETRSLVPCVKAGSGSIRVYVRLTEQNHYTTLDSARCAK